MPSYGSMTITQGQANKTEAEPRPVVEAMKRGFYGRCPCCGEGRLFRAFLKPVDACANCGEEMHHHRADDLPAYLVIVIVSHVVLGAWLMTSLIWDFSMWLHLAIWVPLTIASAIALLQPVKGAVIGLQWANRMHGFGNPDEDPATFPLRDPMSQPSADYQ